MTLDALALVVREDVRDTVRERQLQLVVGIFVLLALLVTYVASRSGGDPELVPPLLALFSMLTPLLALGFFASTIVERRTNGALTVVLGLPLSRAAVVFGTFLGRSLVVSAAIVAALFVAVPIGLAMGVAVDPARLVGVALVLALVGVTFTAIAISISAVVRTTTRATAAAFGVFVCFFFQLWDRLPEAVLYVRNGFSFPETTPEWVSFVSALNPVAAYTYLLSGLFPDLPRGTLVRVPSDPAVYQEPAFALVVLGGWIAFSMGIGYWRFRATDL